MTMLYFVNQKPASAEKSTETLKKFHDIQKQIWKETLRKF